MKKSGKKKYVKDNKKQKGTKIVKVKPNAVQGLRDLLVAELKDIYWAENALTKALPKMIRNATSEELSEALKEHWEITKEQVTRLGKVFSAIGEKPVAKKCEAMDGLLKEAEKIMKSTEKGPVRDAAIILAGQKVEHYEIGTYSSLAAFAGILAAHEAESLLREMLEEEKTAMWELA